MNDKPIQGARYRYVGELKAYQDKIGVASSIIKLGRIWQVSLSNCKEWPPLGLESAIEALSTELMPVLPASEPKDRSFGQQVTKTELAFTGLESDLVADITKALQEQEYLVAVVGQHKAKGSGTTVGYPDLSVRRRTWPDGLACLIEVKTATGELSGEQEDLLKLGWSYVVRSVAGAMSALTCFENEVFGK